MKRVLWAVQTYQREANHIIVQAHAARDSAAGVPSRAHCYRGEDAAGERWGERLPADIIGAEVGVFWRCAVAEVVGTVECSGQKMRYWHCGREGG